MLKAKEIGILKTIIKHCNRINNKLKKVKQSDFIKNDDLIEIVSFNILQIGELAKKFDSDFIKKYPDVPWKKIKGMRDKVAHGYGSIDLNKVWVTANKDIDELLDYCEKILK